MRRAHTITLSALALALTLTAPAAAGIPFTDDFSVEECTFVPNGDQNPYMSLNPGTKLVLAGEEDGEELLVKIKVKGGTRQISFETPDGEDVSLIARVVEEREWEDGELIEVSRNWFARCTETNDIFYFGEDVDIYEDGEIVAHDGAWEAGVDGAQPGIIIPSRFLLGAKYFQEVAPDVALDRAQHVEMGLEFELGEETFEDCVGVVETTPLEPGEESVKAYCPGVGLVLDDFITLVSYRRR